MLSYLRMVPVEIRDEILSYLKPPCYPRSESDLVNFSLCSRACRNLVLPLLFSDIRLTPDSAAAFADGGRLSSVRSYVRSIYLYWRPGSRQYTDLDVIEGVFLNIRSLHLFPSTRDFYISVTFSIEKYLTNNLHVAIWKTISTALPNLKLLDFSPENSEYAENATKSPLEEYNDFQLILSPEARQFLGAVFISDEELSENPTFTLPRSIEQVLLDVPELKLPRHPGAFSYNFPVVASAATLRYMSITVPHLEVADERDGLQTLIFPKLTEIEIKIQEDEFSYERPLKWIAESCPNVQILSLSVREDGRVYDPPPDPVDLAYEELGLMRKLRKFFVPWPQKSGGRYKRRELAGVIQRLLSDGLEYLEEARFSRRTLRRTYTYEFVHRECRISREGMAGIKILWGQPYHGYFRNTNINSAEEEIEEDGRDSGDDLNGPFYSF